MGPGRKICDAGLSGPFSGEYIFWGGFPSLPYDHLPGWIGHDRLLELPVFQANDAVGGNGTSTACAGFLDQHRVAVLLHGLLFLYVRGVYFVVYEVGNR